MVQREQNHCFGKYWVIGCGSTLQHVSKLIPELRISRTLQGIIGVSFHNAENVNMIARRIWQIYGSQYWLPTQQVSMQSVTDNKLAILFSEPMGLELPGRIYALVSSPVHGALAAI